MCRRRYRKSEAEGNKMDWKRVTAKEYVSWAISRLFRLDMHTILAFPIFFFICVLLILEFAAYCLIRLVVPFCEGIYFRIVLSLCLPRVELHDLDDAYNCNAVEKPLQYEGSNSTDPYNRTVSSPVSTSREVIQTNSGDTVSSQYSGDGFPSVFKLFKRIASYIYTTFCTFWGPQYRNLNRRKTNQCTQRSTLKSVYARATYAREINSRRLNCQTFQEYAAYSKKLDDVTSRSVWKQVEDSSIFDSAAVKKRLAQLKEFRQSGDILKLIVALKNCVHFEFAGIFKEHLYSRTYIGTKVVIEEFLDELVLALDFLHSHIDKYGDEIRDLVQHITNQWGATGLILSGGAALAFYHFGVCSVLFNQSTNQLSSQASSSAEEDGNLLPRIICGTSAGAVVAAWLCSRTDEEIRRDLNTDFLAKTFTGFEPNNWFKRFWNIFRKGYMCDVVTWQDFSYGLFGSKTFLEAYEHTGRILNISVTRADRYEPVVVLNYKNAPNVLIYSAVLASMSFPFLGLPFHLKEKSPDGSIMDSKEYESAYFHDGSLRGDVPVGNLKDTWGTKFTIVSQVNLHVFPFCGLRAHGEAGIPINWRGRYGQWKAGFLLSGLELFFKENMRFLLRLVALLDLSPTCRGINCGVLATQSYSGDVTVHPRGLAWRHLKFANDPPHSHIERYIKDGRQMIFPKLSFIMNRLKIDKALERLYLASFTPLLVKDSVSSQNLIIRKSKTYKSAEHFQTTDAAVPVNRAAQYPYSLHIENFLINCRVRPLAHVAPLRATVFSGASLSTSPVEEDS